MKVFTTVLLVIAAVSAAPSHPSLKVIGGQDAALGQFPSIVSLQRKGIYENETPFVHVCAGIIVSPTSILTDAQCVDKRGGNGGIDAVKVVAGTVEITGGNDTFRQELPIGTIIIHPDYNITKEELGFIPTSGLAIVKLNGSFTFNDIVNYSQLPEEGDELEDQDILQFAGWGDKVEGNNFLVQNNLQTVTFPIVNYQDCYDSILKILYNNPSLVNIDEKLSLCTGPLNNGDTLAIFGDEGGPLIKDGIAYGLHSWTINYMNPLLDPGVGPSGVFVKLSSYVPWIKENVPDL